MIIILNLEDYKFEGQRGTFHIVKLNVCHVYIFYVLSCRICKCMVGIFPTDIWLKDVWGAFN